MRLVFYGEQSEFAKQHLHDTATARRPGRCSGRSPCWPRAQSCRASWRSASASPTCSPSSWLETAPDIEPTAGQDFVTTAIAWSLGWRRRLYVWRLYDSPARVLAVRQRFARWRSSPRTKFYWDELYYDDRLPAGGRGRRSRSTGCSSAGSSGARSGSRRYRGRARSRGQRRRPRSGVVRLYATVLAGGRRDPRRLLPGQGVAVTVRPDPPPADRRSWWSASPAAASAERGTGAARRAGGVRAGGRGPDRVRRRRRPAVRRPTGAGSTDFVGHADVRYHVAMDGLSLFMVLLTALGVAAGDGAAS